MFQILGNSKSKCELYFWYSVYSTVLHLIFMTRTSRVAVIMQFTLAQVALVLLLTPTVLVVVIYIYKHTFVDINIFLLPIKGIKKYM